MRIEAELLQVALGEWYYIVLDEAQKIKNWKSQVYAACTGLKASHRLILSGTPMQNSLKELWSLFSFV